MRKLMICLTLLAGGLAGSASASDDRAIFITGSTTLIPIVSNAANVFMDRYPTWRDYNPEWPERPVLIELSGGGSGQGVRAVLDGAAHAGMVSRELRDAELERLGEHEAVLVGIDAVAIAAHRDNPLHGHYTNFSTAELARIFSGEVGRYSALGNGLPDREIVLLVRDASAGSAVMIQNRILGDTPVSSRALQMNSQGQLVRTLTDNTSSFAYISLGLVNAREDLKAFAIDGVEASDANVVNGSYDLSRPMYVVTQATDNRYLRAFLDFLLDDEGQAIVVDQGYIPVRAAD